MKSNNCGQGKKTLGKDKCERKIHKKKGTEKTTVGWV